MKSKKALFVLTFIFLGLKLQSQTNFRPGYIITNAHDTIWGKLDYRSDKRMTQLCSFHSKMTGRKKYKPGEVQSYRFKNNRYFESYTINGKSIFIELLIKGELSVYFYPDVKRRYFIKKRENELTELGYFERTVVLNSAGYGDDGKKYNISEYDYGTSNSLKNKTGEFLIQSQSFKDTLLNTLSDAPELAPEIYSIKKPEHKPLINLAKNYHTTKAGNENYHVYYSKNTRSNNEFSVGWMNINFGELPSDQKFLTYSYSRYTPIYGDKLFLGYGLQYTPIHLEYKINPFSIPKEFQHIFRIPISLRYQYPGKYIKPHVALGCNVYQINDGHQAFLFADILYNVGLSIRVYNGLYLTANYASDLSWDPDVNNSTKAIFTQHSSIGLSIAL